MKIQLKSLALQNFLRFGNSPQTFNFSNIGKHLIMGKSSSGKKNGVGKSTILDGVSYALFGKPLRNINVGSIVNDLNKSNCIVTLDFVVNSEKYKIIRGRKPDKICLMKGSKDISKAVTSEINKQIEDLIAIDYRTFQYLIVFSANSMIPFFDLSKEETRKITERILGLTKLSDMRNEMRNRNSVLAKEYAVETARVGFLKNANETAERLIEENKRDIQNWEQQHETKLADWEVTQKNKIADWEQQHETKLADWEVTQKNKIADWEQQQKERIHQWKNKHSKDIQSLSNKLHEYDSVDVIRQKELHEAIQKEEEQLLSANNQIQTLEREKDSLQSNIKVIQNQLEGFKKENNTQQLQVDSLKQGVCPTCKQSHVDEKLIKHLSVELQNRTLAIKTLDSELKNHQVELSKLDNNITDAERKIINLKGIKEELSKLVTHPLNELLQIEQKKVSLRDAVSILEKEKAPEVKDINPHENIENPYTDETNPHEGLSNPYTNEVNPYSSVILPEIIPVDYDTINNMENEKDRLDYLIKFLDTNGLAKKTLVAKNIPFLNLRCNHYLRLLQSEHKLTFMSDFSATITVGPNEIPFGGLSMGERQRLNLSISLAFRDIVERSAGSTFNVLFLDEILDSSLDTQGIQDCMKIITEFARNTSVYVISHRPEIIDDFDDLIIIERKNQFSSIVTDGEL